jgi:hypothetical protein
VQKNADTSHPASVSSPPEYKNLTKSRVQARLSSEAKLRLEEALLNIADEDAWSFLEEESSSLEFGLAVIESANLLLVRDLAREGDVKALRLLATCLQNNPFAVEKFLEYSGDVAGWLATSNQIPPEVLKVILRIVESVVSHSENVGERAKFIESVKTNARAQLKGGNLAEEERYAGIIEILLQ